MSGISPVISSPMTKIDASQVFFQQASPASIAARIRRIRKSRGWTLGDVETQSQGRIRAVVIGSYERGDRSMSVGRAIEIADLFNIPLSELLCDPNPPLITEGTPLNEKLALVIDLRKANSVNIHEIEEVGAARSLSLFLAWIVGLRQDWNGEVLSIRKSDIDILALLMFKSSSDVIGWLNRYQLLI